MYLEFDLDYPTLWVQDLINELEQWSSKYHIQHRKKFVKLTLRVTFDDDKHYSLFSMTWNPPMSSTIMHHWRLIANLNNRQN